MKYRQFILFAILLPAFLGTISPIKAQHGLEAYFEMAVDSNPAIQAKYYEYLSVAEKVNQSGSIPDPTLSVAYGLSPVETRLGAQEAKFSVTQMFPWFGTSKTKKESFELMAESKREQYLSARNKLVLDIKLAYYALYENHKRLRYTRDLIEILDMLEGIVISKYENNQTGMVNVLQVQMERDELGDRIRQYEDTHITLLTAFNLLVNAPAGSEVSLPDTLFTQQVPEDFPLDSALVHNNEIKALKLKHLGSREMIRAARLNGSPSIGIGLDYSIISKRTDMDIADNGRDVIMPMASLKLPIYRKKYQSAITENTINAESIRYSINQAENKLILDYENAKEAYRDAERKSELYLSQIEKAGQALQLLLIQSETGKLDFDNILKMEQMLIRYRLLLEGAHVKKLNAIATLEYLVSN